MGIIKSLGKVGLGGVAGIVANNGIFPKYSGIGMLQRKLGMGKKRGAEKAGAMPGRPMMDEVEVAEEAPEEAPAGAPTMRKGGTVKKMAKGGMVKKARGVGIAQRGHGKGRMC